MILLRLMFEFFKTGLFSVGGGLATLPFLYDMSLKTGWFTFQDITDMIAVSEATPGAMGINMATYVGFTTAGIPGAVLAALALVTPSIIIILIICKALQKFQKSRLVQDIFYGLRPASAGLIAAAGLGVAQTAFLHADVLGQLSQFWAWFDYGSLLLAAAIFLAMQKWKLHPVAYIGIAAVVGVLFRF